MEYIGKTSPGGTGIHGSPWAGVTAVLRRIHVPYTADASATSRPIANSVETGLVNTFSNASA